MDKKVNGISLKINANGYESKTLGLAVSDEPPEDGLDLVLEEIIQGCKFNTEDLWLYILAFEMLAASFKPDMDELQRHMYEKLRKEIGTIISINYKREQK